MKTTMTPTVENDNTLDLVCFFTTFWLWISVQITLNLAESLQIYGHL